MLSLIKRNLLLNQSANIFVLIAIPIAYAIRFPPIFAMIIFMSAIFFNIFFYDNRSNMNRYSISLPLSKNTIVLSNYVFVTVVYLFLILYQWGWGYLVGLILPYDLYLYSWRDVVFLICLGAMITAIFIPILYSIRSFYLAVSICALIFYGVFFASVFPLVEVLQMNEIIIFNELDQGFTLIIEKYLPNQPYLLLSVLTVILLFISFQLSRFIFIRRDF